MKRLIPCSAGNWPFAHYMGFWLAFACLCATASGPESAAADLLITAQRESNSNLRIEIPSFTTEYHLLRATETLTDWGLTGLVLGVEGVTSWRDEGALARNPRRFYRISSRPVSQPVDSDGDGISDSREYMLGSDPTIPDNK